MKHLFLLAILIALQSCTSNTTSTENNTTTNNDSTATTHNTFPEDWIGTYEGDLELINAQKGKTSTLPMTLTISETDSSNRWKWYSKALYNGQEIIKDYELVRPDSSKPNLFVMDEKNGIVLDRIYLDGAFYDYFEVGKLGLYGITRKVGDDIHFEIASFPLASKTYSTYEGKDFNVDTVTSFKVFNTQKVLLKRVAQ